MSNWKRWWPLAGLLALVAALLVVRQVRNRQSAIVKEIDVVKRGDEWVAEADGATLAHARTKADALKATAEVARSDPADVTVRIHRQDGQLQRERSYPGHETAAPGER